MGKIANKTKVHSKKTTVVATFRSGKYWMISFIVKSNEAWKKKYAIEIVHEDERTRSKMQELGKEVHIEDHLVNLLAVKGYEPPILHPQKRKKKANECHYQNFLEMHKNFQVNMPFF